MTPSNTIDILYDGNCRFLVWATRFLKRRDRRNRVHLANTAARKFDAASFERSPGELSGEIYARMPDGAWLKGLDAFRQFGSVVGLRLLVLLTELPVIRLFLNAGYSLFAKWLLKTRRTDRQKPVARATVTASSSSGPVIPASS
ncbi:MAG: DUF393 domain-containing protein [Fuerstia sp.]|nr:DUF393 domain-containing protein [Fuerstiella sp.]